MRQPSGGEIAKNVKKSMEEQWHNRFVRCPRDMFSPSPVEDVFVKTQVVFDDRKIKKFFPGRSRPGSAVLLTFQSGEKPMMCPLDGPKRLQASQVRMYALVYDSCCFSSMYGICSNSPPFS